LLQGWSRCNTQYAIGNTEIAMIYANILEMIGNTPLVQLTRTTPNPNVQIFAKLEGQNPTGSVKDRIAKYMIDAAEREGLLTPDKIILEPTSGNTGIGLAMIGKLKGYRVMVVMPESVSEERAQLLKAYGAEIVYSDGIKGTNGSIVVAQQMVAEAPQRFFMPYQYGNEMNPRAHYETTGPEIVRDLPDLDVFVSGLGTGGTLTGTGRFLKEYNPAIKVIATVPHPGDLVQGLRSLEEGFIPPVLDESVLDGRVVVDSRTSFAATKELTHTEGIFAGISAGAAIKTAQRVAGRMERGKIVVLLADGGWKYLSTNLWTTEYDDLPDDIDSKVWW
jgi:cysteine synthase B